MDYSLLSACPLFKGISTPDIEIIFSSIPFRIRKFQSGSMVCMGGEQVKSLLVVISGVVKGEMADYAGRVIKIEDIPAPGTIAPAFIFGKKNRFPVNVIAISPVEILLIDKFDFLNLLKKNDSVLINFLDMISNRSQFLTEKIKFLNFKTIKGKLAHYILQRSVTDGNVLSLGLTQNDLADFFGVTRPSVSRALGDLEREGYIVANGKNIKIINKKGLAEQTTD
jgi:CRP-like cAMP-binding protein